MVAAVVLTLCSSKADEVAKLDPIPLPPSKGPGRKIASAIVEFGLPRFARVRSGLDADYIRYVLRYGKESEKLVMVFGPLVGGYEPKLLADESIKWAARDLICDGDPVGTDYRGSDNGRQWRHLGLFGGFAEYADVSQEAAAYFDKILDSASCGKR